MMTASNAHKLIRQAPKGALLSRAFILNIILTIGIACQALFSFPISNDITACSRGRSDSLPAGRSGWTNTKESVASQGKLWTPRKIRTFSRSKVNHKDDDQKQSVQQLSGPRGSQWVVVTTIFKPTKLVRQISDLPHWCLVVVGDKKTNDSIWYDYASRYSNKVKYLSASDQIKLPYNIISAIPWNHFGRKNIGYLYAIHHGAQVIWDTDDDNELKTPNLLDVLASGATSRRTNFFKIESNHHLWNPYPSFNSSPICSTLSKGAATWPRGMPLPYIKDYTAHLTGALSPAVNVAVFQSLADNDPDVDAIYRLSQPLPIQFHEFRNISQTVVLPQGRIAPFNAQATLWTKQSFWGLLLPITVHGRVSDIWRSYITQRLMHEVGMHLSFTPPIVTQIRNVHSYLADLDAEMPLYTQAHEMVKWIYQWQSPENISTLNDALEELVTDLYEIGIIEQSDVSLTQHWINDLESVGYVQPRVLKEQKNFVFDNFRPSTVEMSNKASNCAKDGKAAAISQ